MKIGFIGLGIMGSRMARNLVKAGFDISVYNRDKSKTENFKKDGVKIFDSVSSIVEDCQIIITMVSTPDAIKAIANDGLISSLDSDKLWIDCTTVDPDTTLELAKLTKPSGAGFMDAPVAGSLKPAENGELVFLVGGSEENFEKSLPLLDVMGKKSIHAGPIGKGSAMKLVVNMMLGAGMAAFSEVLNFGKAMGFDSETIFSTLSPLPVTPPMIGMKEARVLGGDYSPEFPLQWMSKDLMLALQMASKSGVELPILKTVDSAFRSAKDDGLGEDDFSAILKKFI